MKKLDYLRSIYGQINSRNKRLTKRGYFLVNQEPGSKKSLSRTEKEIFRAEIIDQLKKLHKRAYRKDIILKISFLVTKKNAPSIHSLTKNYLDLLHKEMPEIDSHKRILFGDDNQIKILIADYQIDLEKENGHIFIQTQNIGDLIKDLELFNSFDTENEDYTNDLDQSLERLEWLEDTKDVIGENYEKLKRMWSFDLQSNFLKTHNIKPFSLAEIFRSRFSSYKKILKHTELKSNLLEFERMILFSSNFQELGNSPQKKVKLDFSKMRLELSFINLGINIKYFSR